jgi:hypothetical protein
MAASLQVEMRRALATSLAVQIGVGGGGAAE